MKIFVFHLDNGQIMSLKRNLLHDEHPFANSNANIKNETDEEGEAGRDMMTLMSRYILGGGTEAAGSYL